MTPESPAPLTPKTSMSRLGGTIIAIGYVMVFGVVVYGLFIRENNRAADVLLLAGVLAICAGESIVEAFK